MSALDRIGTLVVVPTGAHAGQSASKEPATAAARTEIIERQNYLLVHGTKIEAGFRGKGIRSRIE